MNFINPIGADTSCCRSRLTQGEEFVAVTALNRVTKLEPQLLHRGDHLADITGAAHCRPRQETKAEPVAAPAFPPSCREEILPLTSAMYRCLAKAELILTVKEHGRTNELRRCPLPLHYREREASLLLPTAGALLIPMEAQVYVHACYCLVASTGANSLEPFGGSPS